MALVQSKNRASEEALQVLGDKMDNLKKVTFKNSWEAHKYYVDGKFVEDGTLDHVWINGERQNLIASKVSVPYIDWGHSYTATSTHYFVDTQLLGVRVQIPLYDFISKTEVLAEPV